MYGLFIAEVCMQDFGRETRTKAGCSDLFLDVGAREMISDC
jgi:hypothetical protein